MKTQFERWVACIVALAITGPSPSSGIAAEISFRNDVMAVLSKSGCNLGTCHGNARGKGGFQISLRGQDPAADYLVLTHEIQGRRANPNDPDRSLILQKPSMKLAHEGGKRFSAESTEYQILRQWIAAGMPNDPVDAPRLMKMYVTPQEVFLQAETDPVGNSTTPRWQQQITAIAEFSDGSRRDVTSLAVHELSQPIATVTREGLVTAYAPGETIVIVRYLHLQVPVRFAFVSQREGFAWSGMSPSNFVDDQVFEKLHKLKINPSPVCDDATFIRRASLDLIGLLPTAEEARQFVADTASDKRARLIDSLLERPEFSDWWAMKWADLLRIEEKTLDRKGVENFHAWLRGSFASHKPLDQMVREIVASRGSTYEVPPANFYRALRTPFERSEAVGQLFLGVRLQCCKCHNHPFDRWTQDDYYGWGSVFAKVDYKILENRRRDSNDKHEFDGEQIVFLNAAGEAKDPRTNAPRSSQLLGEARPMDARRDPLNGLADWLTDPHHDRFVQMMANRIWQQVMARGIVDPIDDFRATNPPSNPALLNALSHQLAFGNPLGLKGEHSKVDNADSATSRSARFDLRELLRVILNSKTYQLSSESNETNRDDDVNFSRSLVRRLSAEQLLDATSQALNIPLQFAGYPKGRRAGQLPGVTTTRGRDNGSNDPERFLQMFGKPPRLQSCDCERSEETTLGQTFQLVSGTMLNRLLTEKSNRLDSLLSSGKSSQDMITELYWTVLTRAPGSEELAAMRTFLEKGADRRAALEDITWSLVNSNEFLLRR